jgi:hypothetical protein
MFGDARGGFAMGLFDWLFGKRSVSQNKPEEVRDFFELPSDVLEAQPASPRRPRVIRGLDDGSPFVFIENGNGVVTVMDRMAYEYMYGESNKPDPSQSALDGLLARVARVKVWAGGMMRDNPTSDVLLADVTRPALLESFRRAFRISEDPTTFGHCMCLGQPTLELFDEAGQRVGTLGMQHGHAVRWDFWKHDARLLDGNAIRIWLTEQSVASEHQR